MYVPSPWDSRARILLMWCSSCLLSVCSAWWYGAPSIEVRLYLGGMYMVLSIESMLYSWWSIHDGAPCLQVWAHYVEAIESNVALWWIELWHPIEIWCPLIEVSSIRRYWCSLMDVNRALLIDRCSCHISRALPLMWWSMYEVRLRLKMWCSSLVPSWCSISSWMVLFWCWMLLYWEVSRCSWDSVLCYWMMMLPIHGCVLRSVVLSSLGALWLNDVGPCMIPAQSR